MSKKRVKIIETVLALLLIGLNAPASTEGGNAEDDFESAVYKAKSILVDSLSNDQLAMDKMSKSLASKYTKNKKKLMRSLQENSYEFDHSANCSFVAENTDQTPYCIGDEQAGSLVWAKTYKESDAKVYFRSKIYFHKFDKIIINEIAKSLMHEHSHHINFNESEANQIALSFFHQLNLVGKKNIIDGGSNIFEQTVVLPLIGHGYASYVDLGDMPGWSTLSSKYGMFSYMKAVITLSPVEYVDVEDQETKRAAMYGAIVNGRKRCDLLAGEIVKVLNPKSVKRVETVIGRWREYTAESIVSCRLKYKELLTLSSFASNSALLDDNEEIQKLGSFSTLLNQLVMSRILDSKDLSIDDLISLKSLQMTQSGGFEQFSEQLKYSVFSKIDQALGLDGRFDYVKIRQKLESAQNGSVVEKKEVGGVYEYAKELEKMGDNQ
ncbi:MAG: hypothetical protein VX583_07540 [Bdellovibrionota bacterium]